MYHVFFGDQIFDREIVFGLDNLGAARIGVRVAQFDQFGTHDGHPQRL